MGDSKILYAKGSNLDADSIFEMNATMFGRSLNRDNRTAQQLLEEAMHQPQQLLRELRGLRGESCWFTSLKHRAI